jgi:hypothetical protein
MSTSERSNYWTTATTIPDDTTLVHKTGNETVGPYANKTFVDSMIICSGVTDDAGIRIVGQSGLIQGENRDFNFIVADVNNDSIGLQDYISGHTGTTIASRTSSQMHLPTVSATDNGKVLRVSNGAWGLVSPATIYTGSNAPNQNLGVDGDIYLQTS